MRYRKPASAPSALKPGARYWLSDCQIDGVMVVGKAAQPAFAIAAVIEGESTFGHPPNVRRMFAKLARQQQESYSEKAACSGTRCSERRPLKPGHTGTRFQ